MADLQLVRAARRSELRAAVRARLTQLGRGLRVLAEDVLGAEDRIDIVACDVDGRVAVVLVAEPGRELERVVEAVAHRVWVGARLADWRQLAPELPVETAADVAAIVLLPEAGPRVRALATALGANAPAIWIYRCVRNGAGLDVLLEPGGRDVEVPSPSRDPGLTSTFRSGITDAQLGLTPEEIAEFD